MCVSRLRHASGFFFWRYDSFTCVP